MWIDEEYTLVTGNTTSTRAFRLDLENALLIRDPQGQIQNQRQAELQSILQHTSVLADYQDLQSSRTTRHVCASFGATQSCSFG